MQSVAVRLVVDREREIDAFKAREYWSIGAILQAAQGEAFPAELLRIDGKALEIGDEATAAGHAEALRASRPVITAMATRTTRPSPKPPFTTSTLQQDASRKLGFNPKRTMRAAQRLYEGMDTAEGPVGLITYMRTDSTAMASTAMAEAGRVVLARFGKAYVMPKGRVFKTKAKGAQEAHEAIRPTSFARDPDSLPGSLGHDEVRLYKLIWQRAIASQMAAKELETSSVDLETGRYLLRATATRTVFDGFARAYTEGRDEGDEEEVERQLPPLSQGDEVAVTEVTPAQHFTQPPPRYSEATLIKALEELGIGRPSTYAATISTIVDRGYVEVRERRLYPTAVGAIVTDLLVEHFGDYVDFQFTARMEEELDEVASGQREWVPLLRDFYGPFKTLVDEKRAELKRSDFTTEETDEVCSEGHPMVIRLGRNGRFLACSTYPDHKETRPLPGEEPEVIALEGVGETCPTCNEGTLVAKRGRFGAFAGCSRYPDCSYIRKSGPPPPDPLPFTVTCPKCEQGSLTARRARRTGTVFWGCSRYPKCDFTTSREPLGVLHDVDSGPVARNAEAGICLRCGAAIVLPEPIVVGELLAGGPADPAAIAPSARRGDASRAAKSAPRKSAAPRKTARVAKGGKGAAPDATAVEPIALEDATAAATPTAVRGRRTTATAA